MVTKTLERKKKKKIEPGRSITNQEFEFRMVLQSFIDKIFGSRPHELERKWLLCISNGKSSRLFKGSETDICLIVQRLIHVPRRQEGRYWTAAAAAKSLQSCPTLWDPIGGSPPGSPIPGILQARTLEWAAISFSNACMHAKLLQSCPTLCWSGLPCPSPTE